MQTKTNTQTTVQNLENWTKPELNIISVNEETLGTASPHGSDGGTYS